MIFVSENDFDQNDFDTNDTHISDTNAKKIIYFEKNSFTAMKRLYLCTVEQYRRILRSRRRKLSF